MLTVTPLFDRLQRATSREFDARVLINEIPTDELKIVDFVIEHQLCPEDDYSIGYFGSKRLTLKLRALDIAHPELEDSTLISVEVRLRNLEPLVGEDDWSEYLNLGKFYIDGTPVIRDNVIEIVAYDFAKTLSNDKYLSNLTYPATVDDLTTELVYNGYNFLTIPFGNPSANINIPYYNNTEPMSVRDILAYLAGLHGGNAVLKSNGKVDVLVHDDFLTVNKFNISPSEMYSFKQTNFDRSVKYVLMEGETVNFESGVSGEFPLIVSNPFATQVAADYVKDTLSEFTYKPYECEFIGFLNIEAGDVVELNKFTGVTWINTLDTWANTEEYWDGTESFIVPITNLKLQFNGGLKAVISTGGKSKFDLQTNVDGILQSKVKNLDKYSVKENRVYYGVKIKSEDGITVSRNDLLARALFNADTLSFQKGNGSGGFTDVLYFDVLSGKYKFVGDVEITGDIIGGTINIGNGKFQVASNGTLTATGANISGNISLSAGSSIDWNFVNTDPDTTSALNTANSASNTASAALTVVQQIANGSYSGGTFINGNTIYSPNIYSNAITIQPVLSGTNTQTFNLNAFSGSSLLNVLRISSFTNPTPYVMFDSTNGAYAFWNFGVSIFNGNLDFSNANISGFDVVAKFG